MIRQRIAKSMWPVQRVAVLENLIFSGYLSSRRMEMRNKRRRLLGLFARDPHCHWCRCSVVIMPRVPKLKNMPDNAATLDHLRSRFHPRRQEPVRYGERRIVLACNACNQRRCQEEQRQIGAEELRRRSENGLRRKVFRQFSLNEIAIMSLRSAVARLKDHRP